MNKNKNILIIVFTAIFFTFSCTDESKFTNPVTFHLEQGAFATFSEGIAPNGVSFEIPSEAQFTRTITDPAGNIASYSLSFTATLVTGQVTVVNDFFTTTSFPSTLNVTAQGLADAMGLTLGDLNFGDNFQFIATVVRNDGQVFLGSAPGLNADGSLQPGNTEPTLLLPSYNNAMNFGFTFACPAFPNTDLIGIWDVDVLGFAAFFGETQPDREILAGPAGNQITIVGGEYPTAGGMNDDLIITFTEIGIVTAVNEDGIAIGPGNSQGISTNTYLLNRGLLLPCVDLINLSLNFEPLSNNIHPFNLTR